MVASPYNINRKKETENKKKVMRNKSLGESLCVCNQFWHLKELLVCLQPILAPERATDYFAITSHLEPKNVLRHKGYILLCHPITLFCPLCFCLQRMFTSSLLLPPVLKSSLPIKVDFHFQLYFTQTSICLIRLHLIY